MLRWVFIVIFQRSVASVEKREMCEVRAAIDRSTTKGGKGSLVEGGKVITLHPRVSENVKGEQQKRENETREIVEFEEVAR